MQFWGRFLTICTKKSRRARRVMSAVLSSESQITRPSIAYAACADITRPRVVSKTHLKSGDPLPDLRDGVPWLFSMRFSPFAHSVRLVLMTKGISYDEIYCDLRRKPEFLLERNHIGKIPVLEVNGKIIIESVVICELLEELYPDPPLYPKDPFEKAQQRIVLEIYRAKVCQPMEYALRSFTKDNKDVDTVMDGLKIIERRLMKRETPFFGGPKPGMVDLIMWPFNEGLIILDPEYEMVRAQMPNLFNYFQHMMTIPAIQATTLPRELHVQFLLGLLTKKFQYDFPEITL